VNRDDEIKLKMILRDNHSTNQELAPAVGFEPTTNRLTADRSTTELRWIVSAKSRKDYILPNHSQPASANRLIPTTVGTLPLSYAGSPTEKPRVHIFAHDWLEATANQLIAPL